MENMISNEIKAKVFAQYLGHPMLIPDLDENYEEELTGIQLNSKGGHPEGYMTLEGSGYHFNDEKLILKPLSAITDEDAIEALNILLVQKGSYYKDWPKGLQSQWLKIIKLELTENFGCTQIQILPYFKNVFMVSELLKYLGYDMPHYLLGGKTLHEAGLAIYE